MTTARDTYNQIEYAKEEGEKKGLERGREEGKLEIARKMLAMGLDVDTIATATELTHHEIVALKEPKAE